MTRRCDYCGATGAKRRNGEQVCPRCVSNGASKKDRERPSGSGVVLYVNFRERTRRQG